MKTWKDRLNAHDWISESDRALFSRFAEDAEIHQIGEKRIEKYRTDLCIAHSMTAMHWCEITKNIPSMKRAIQKINGNQKYSFESKRDCKRTLGSLYNFRHTKDRSLKYAPRELKELIAHIERAADKRLAKPIILRSEMRELLKYSLTDEDSALISLLFESGMRMGEFIQLKKSDIRQVQEGLIIRVPPGKTGEREIIVVEPTKYVMRWLQRHPIKKEDAYLWPAPPSYDHPTTPNALVKRLRKIVARLNKDRKKKGLPLFSKPYNPHNFRHSRASEMGGQPGMTEQMLCKYFGWEIGSDMPRTYLHLTFEQLKTAVLAGYGKASKEEKQEIITERECQRCHEINPIADGYCSKCGSDMETGKTVSKLSELQDEVSLLKRQHELLKQMFLKKENLNRR